MLADMTSQPRITDNAALLLRAMVQNPRVWHTTPELVGKTGVNEMTTRRILRKLGDAGWLTAYVPPRRNTTPAVRYRFTVDGLITARQELKQWTFTDPA